MKSLLIISVITGLIAISGCHHHPPDNGKNDTLGMQLLHLTRAVDATLREAPDLSDEALLERSTSHDPALRQQFASYRVTIVRAGMVFALLVCTGDGARGLLEDASCTPKLDRKLWEQSPAAACQPTLQLAVVCGP